MSPLSQSRRILLVEDDVGIRFGMSEYLRARGWAVDAAEDCASALQAVRENEPEALVVDHFLPDGTALDLLARLGDAGTRPLVVVLTAHGTIDLAVAAMKSGAEHFLTKPVDLATLELVLARSLDNRRLRQQQAVRARLDRGSPDPFVGTSAAIRELREQAHRLLDAETPVLMLGETGVGKGVLARWLHEHGPRAEEAFVDVNCGALTREFLESELFGHEKGAFTGASAAKAGLLELAGHGTAFLDEIGDMSLAVQAALLKVIEEKRFRRLGSVGDRMVTARVVTATHRSLGELAKQGKFRRDLYFRISALPLLLPSLRERVEDLPHLAERLLASIAVDLRRGEVALEPDAVQALQRYAWPGNVRELRNVLERALLLTDRTRLRAGDLRFESDATPSAASPAAAGATPADGGLTLREVERRHISRVLDDEGGSVERAARRLGVPRSSLYEKIRRFGLRTSRF